MARHPCLDLTTWPLQCWCRMKNIHCAFALFRAHAEVGSTKELPYKFEEYLTAANALK